MGLLSGIWPMVSVGDRIKVWGETVRRPECNNRGGGDGHEEKSGLLFPSEGVACDRHVCGAFV